MGALKPGLEYLCNILSSSRAKSGGIFDFLNANYSDFG